MIYAGNPNIRALPIPTKPRDPGTTQPILRAPIVCGTREAYIRHLEWDQRPCDACTKAVKPKPARIASRPELDIQAATDSYLAGASLMDLAREHHVERNRLRSMLAEAGVTIRRPGGAHRAGQGMARKPKPRKERVYEPPFDIDEGARLYEAGMSFLKVSEVFGVTEKTVRVHLNKAGVQSRPRHETHRGKRHPNIVLPVDEIASAYLEGESCPKLAERYGVSDRTIRARLIDAGVVEPGQIRRPSGYRAANAIPAHVEDEVVRLLEAGVSKRAASRVVGVAQSTVGEIAKRRGVAA